MTLTMMRAKLHNATVTETILEYEGSISIDEELINKAGMLVNEKVQVVNLNNGERFETYIIRGEKGSKAICLNGPAARLALPGDRVIIIAYGQMTEEEAQKFEPTVVILDKGNVIKAVKK
jgi:aspartate 1-decarboxylase